MMERLYVKKIGERIHVYYRPTHEYIGEGKKLLKDMCDMCIDKFYTYIAEKRLRVLSQEKLEVLEKSRDYAEKENWYKNAWITHTKTIEKSLRIKIPSEVIPSNIYVPKDTISSSPFDKISSDTSEDHHKAEEDHLKYLLTMFTSDDHFDDVEGNKSTKNKSIENKKEGISADRKFSFKKLKKRV